jgi:F420-0:gamma-glutamyl ligase
MKHLFAALGGTVWARVPLKTDLVGRGDDLDDLLRRQVAQHVKPGDVVVMAEKPIAASQGRSYALDEIHPTRLAKVLSKAVTKTPHGIGLGIPETMQLAIDEAGAPRIVAAAAASAAGKVVGKRGLFYKIAGSNVEAIDGPTWNTLPPHNTHAKLGPADPDGVAAHLSALLSDAAGGPVEFVVIDANDLTATVLGASPGADRVLAATLMRDNPLGQGHEQTPVCVLRPLGQLPSQS